MDTFEQALIDWMNDHPEQETTETADEYARAEMAEGDKRG